MKRYFFEISYKGTSYSGWQKQENALSVQDEIENRLALIYNQPIETVGCGRTDAGVHARQYFFHADIDPDRYKAKDLLHKLNTMTGPDIAFHDIIEVPEQSHARFDAFQRTYHYHIVFGKDVFRNGLAYRYAFPGKPDPYKLVEAAELILNFNEFYPFCKSDSDAAHYGCDIIESKWLFENDQWSYTVTANRFLRGMVRLIVGMCINVARDKLTIAEVKQALEQQKRLSRPWSVPAEGLYLTRIKYPFLTREIE